jgi:hypothetical protein
LKRNLHAFFWHTPVLWHGLEMIGERKMKRNSLRAHLSRISIFSQLQYFSDGPGNRRSTHRGLVMKSRILKRARIAAMLFLFLFVVLSLAGTSHAAGFQGGVPWQVGDVVICFGSGTCNVVRVIGSTVTLLDQFSDGLSTMGDTRGVAINNNLHGVVTDNGSGTGSNVVVFSIASVNPFTGAAIPHTPANTFTTSGNNAQAVVVNNIGHIFVGNSGSGGSIVELNADGTPASAFSTGSLFTNPLPLAGCADTSGQLLSMDLSKDGLSMYLTTSNTSYQTSTSNGGHIQKITLSTGACAPFASFGPGVALNGIQDVPAGALAGVTPDCKGTPCPTTRDTILVVAEGFFDSDGDPGAGEPGPGGIPDSTDDVNICNSLLNSPLVSCALLLDTGGPGLTAPAWIATHTYSNGDTVLDANLHVQQVTAPATSGNSGGTTPAWKTDGTTTSDGDLTWTDRGTSVVARYPVTGKSTLQALALDPLVSDCTTGCSSSAPPPKASNFWIGDNGSANFYMLDFATGASGAPTALSANANAFGINGVCLTCSTANGGIQGLRIYGGEGANQPDLTKLVTAVLTPASPPTQSQSVVAQFPLPGTFGTSLDTNKLTTTLYSLTSTPIPALTPLTIYASAIVPASGTSDPQPAAIPPSPGVPCEPTTSTLPVNCILWKLDITPPSGTVQSSKIQGATGVDNGTHGFVDEFYDVTAGLGNGDPLVPKQSVHMLHEVPFNSTTAPGGGHCVFTSPVPGHCFQSPTTVKFQFSCSTFIGSLASLLPRLSITAPSPGNAPKPIPLQGTNGQNNYFFDGTQWGFTWKVPQPTPANPITTYNALTIDFSDQVQGFSESVTVASKCPK